MKKEAEILDALHCLDAKITFLGAVYDSMQDLTVQGVVGYSYILNDMLRDIKEIREIVKGGGDE